MSNPGSGGGGNENLKLKADVFKEIGRVEQKMQEQIDAI